MELNHLVRDDHWFTARCLTVRPRSQEREKPPRFPGWPSIWFGLLPVLLDSRASSRRLVGGLVVAAHDAPILPALRRALGKGDSDPRHHDSRFDITRDRAQPSPIFFLDTSKRPALRPVLLEHRLTRPCEWSPGRRSGRRGVHPTCGGLAFSDSVDSSRVFSGHHDRDRVHRSSHQGLDRGRSRRGHSEDATSKHRRAACRGSSRRRHAGRSPRQGCNRR